MRDDAVLGRALPLDRGLGRAAGAAGAAFSNTLRGLWLYSWIAEINMTPTQRIAIQW